ncbi:hypothetical protein ABFY60_00830 [Lysinibacillus pakistanensis]|uniref:hypothetical protein n=1 Tax=Lysinibacillus pakistanensis TaxID=759811 RepID=UPI003D266745
MHFCVLIWAIFSIFTFSRVGYQYIGKSYFQSENFQHEIDNFQSQLGPLVLNLPTADDLKSKIEVTQGEIEDHRNYYGSLGEQIDNIKAQYESRIQEATNVNATDLKTKLEKERDEKIKDITANFEDDEHVRKKILAQKEEVIDQYIKAAKDEAKSFVKNYNYWSYELTNTDTGENISFSDVSESSAYKIRYTPQHPLTTWNISDNLSHIFYRTDTSVETETLRETTDYTGTITISKKLAQLAGIMEGYEQFTRNQYIFFFIWITGILAAVFCMERAQRSATGGTGYQEKEALARMKIDFQLIILFISSCIYWAASEITLESIEYHYQNNYVKLCTRFFI